ncbi:hypothetical protein, partial [Acidiphilium multivorum]
MAQIVKDAQALFTVPEDEYSFTRTLAAPMCLVQCLAVASAAILQGSRDELPRIPTVTEKDRS